MGKPDRPEGNDPLTPFEQALRSRVPSREALLAEAKAQSARQRRRKQALGSGLALVALSVLSWVVDPAWRTEDIRTAYGQRDEVRLADGSLILLNSATHLRIEKRLRTRQFELLGGEATFTVTHGDAPFIVRSQGVVVRDIGTIFNVRSDSRGVATTVVEGAVEVSARHGAPQRLERGEQSLVNAGQPGTVTKTVPGQATAWQQGKLRFDGTPLRDVLADVRRYRQPAVRLADPRLGELRVSGEFDTAAVEALIDLLPAILPVWVSRSGDGSVVVSGL